MSSLLGYSEREILGNASSIIRGKNVEVERAYASEVPVDDDELTRKDYVISTVGTADEWVRVGTLITPKTTGDTVGVNTIQTETGTGTLTHSNLSDFSANIKSDTIVPSSASYITIDTTLNTDFLKQHTGACILSGMVISDGGSGTIDISAGEVLLRTTDSETGVLSRLSVGSVTGQAITADQAIFIYYEYNGGSPQYVYSTSKPTSQHTQVMAGIAVYETATTTMHLCTQCNTNINSEDIYNFWRIGECERYKWAEGILLSETGTRNIAISSGKFYAVLSPVIFSAFDSSGADTFDYYYGTSSLTVVTGQSAIDNTQYDNSGVLTALGANKYGIHWVFAHTDGHVNIIYGKGSYTLGDALEATKPLDSQIPPAVLETGFLIGRIIIKKSDTTFTRTHSAFTTGSILGSSGVSNHDDLVGLADDDHTQYALLNGRNTNILKIDDIQEFNSGHGVEIDGVSCISGRGVFNATTVDYSLIVLGNSNGHSDVQLKCDSTSDHAVVVYEDNASIKWSAGLSATASAWYIYNNTLTADALSIANATSIVTIPVSLKTNIIDEYGSGIGVTIDNILLKDSTISDTSINIQCTSATGYIYFKDNTGTSVLEYNDTSDEWVFKDTLTVNVGSCIKTNCIQVYNAVTGVSVEGVDFLSSVMTIDDTSAIIELKNATGNYSTVDNYVNASRIWQNGCRASSDYEFYNDITNNIVMRMVASDDHVEIWNTLNVDTIAERNSGVGVTMNCHLVIQGDGNGDSKINMDKDATADVCTISFIDATVPKFKLELDTSDDLLLYNHTQTVNVFKAILASNTVEMTAELKVDKIDELAADGGIDIQNTLIKNNIIYPDLDTTTHSFGFSGTGLDHSLPTGKIHNFIVDASNEFQVVDDGIKCDVISELNGTGVLIDSVQCIDGGIICNPTSTNDGLTILGDSSGNANFSLDKDASGDDSRFNWKSATATQYWMGVSATNHNFGFYTSLQSEYILQYENSTKSIKMIPIYNKAVTATRDIYAQADGTIGYDASVTASKMNISGVITADTDFIYSVPVKKFQKRTTDEDGKYTNIPHPEIEYGSLAEDMDIINSDFTFNNAIKDHTVECIEKDKIFGNTCECDCPSHDELAGINYKKFIPILIKCVQDQKNTIDEMNTRLLALE